MVAWAESWRLSASKARQPKRNLIGFIVEKILGELIIGNEAISRRKAGKGGWGKQLPISRADMRVLNKKRDLMKRKRSSVCESRL